MTVTVGTDVFISVADADTFFARRGNTAWAALSTEQKEVFLVKASDAVERRFRWRGTRATAAQRLGWPRLDAFDNDDLPLLGIPWQVEEATCLTAEQLVKGVDLDGVLTTDLLVKSEKVDVISIHDEMDTKGKTVNEDRPCCRTSSSSSVPSPPLTGLS